jgi:branched-chain amino acid transport system substrate-binding protein
MIKTQKIALIIFMISVLFIFGCSNSADTSTSTAAKVIKIGVIQPFSGPNAQAGEETFRGNELAAKEINKNGGLLGRKVVLVKADATNAQEAISEAERLITKEKVDILTGTYLSGVAYPATQIANKHNVLYWETNALAPNITEQGFKNVIRISWNTDTLVDVAINSIKDVIAPKLVKSDKDLNVVIIHEQSIYGTSVGEKEEQRLKKLGVKVKRIPYDPASADLSSVVNLSKKENPDIWLRTGYVNDGVLLLKTARDVGWKPPVILGISDDSKYLVDALGAEGMEGILSVSLPTYDMNEKYGPGVKTLTENYKKEYKSDPKMPQTIVSYGGTKILFDLIKQAKSTSTDKIRNAALKMDVPVGGKYPTGFGVMLNPKTLDNTRAYPILTQWQDGKATTVYPEAAVGAAKEITLPLKGW